MIKEVNIKNRSVRCKLKKNKRGKNIILKVIACDEIQVTLPPLVGFGYVLKVIKQKEAWLDDRLKNYKDNSISEEEDEKNYKKYKESAREFVTNKVKYFDRKLGFGPSKIFIKKQKTRWGSCSSLGNLNFNYKILFLPESLADYIIVHELCHLREMNHSAKFWGLVGEVISDYKERRQELSKWKLHI